MLTKIIGTGTVVTLSGTAQPVYPLTDEYGNYNGLRDQRLPATKVRIATGSQPAYIAFGTTATSSSGILMPANCVEHFRIDANTLTNYVSVLQAGTAGVISIVAVA